MALSKIPNYLQDLIDSDAIGANAISTTKIPDNAVTPNKVNPTLMSWEHIQTKVWSSNGDTNSENGSGKIYFSDVFTSDYICYKLIIGWAGTTTTENANMYLRYLTTGTSEQSGNYYYGSHVIERSSGDRTVNTFNPQTVGTVWSNLWPVERGGVHGEINFYNMKSPVVNGVNVNRGDVYRPFCEGTLIGYDNTYGYARGTFHVRFNTEYADDYHRGFLIYNSANDPWWAGTHMSLYGLKVPV